MLFEMIRLIFCITGMPGSGKSLVADAAKQLGFRVVSMGDVIREEAGRRCVPKSPKSLGTLMLKLRREEGSDVVAKRCLAMVRESKSSVLIEGLRSLDELNYFKQNADVQLIAVHASPSTRFDRLLKRGRPDDPKERDAFDERDLRELQVGIGSIIALADHVFVNEGTLGDIGASAKAFFEGLLNAKNS